MMKNQCTTVDVGSNPLGCPEFMVGTQNGSVLSWYYDEGINNQDTNNHNQVSEAMKKEFENHKWSYVVGALTGAVTGYLPSASMGGNYDYWTQVQNSTDIGRAADDYRFISTLEEIKDVKFGDDYWVVVGQQGVGNLTYGTFSKAIDPDNVGCGSKAYGGLNDGKGAGSYINVRYYYDIGSDGIPKLAWKAVKVDNSTITFISVAHCEGVWYAMGFYDEDNDGIQDENNENETAVIFYATDPLNCYSASTPGGWQKAKTRGASGAYSAETTTAGKISGGADGSATELPLVLKGVNAMASQEG
jgi:hypothetical protein